MPEMSQESILTFTSLQSQIWLSVAFKASEASGAELSFSSPQTDYVPASSLFAETTEPKVVIQFSFSNLPESMQAVLVPLDTILAIASELKGEAVKEVSDTLISELRPTLEAFVQGICLAVGKLHSAAVVASGLSIRHQTFAFPQNMQSAEAVFATAVEMKVQGFTGRIVWLADPETARLILGIEEEEEAVVTSSGRVSSSSEDSLEMLMDIPLQISVELGRVKMVVKDVVELGSGSIIEIDKAAGEPVDVLVNGKVVARGEVVVIEDNFGVRITEILSQQDRLAKLREAA